MERMTRASVSTKDTPTKEDWSVTGASPKPNCDDEVEEASSAPSPPGLETPTEWRYMTLDDFLPESRKYGEMPVRAGEEIFVNSAPLDDWIYGVKRGPQMDEGWLPASVLGIGDSRADGMAAGEEKKEEVDAEDGEEQEADLEVQGQSRTSGSRRGRRNGNTTTAAAAGDRACGAGNGRGGSRRAPEGACSGGGGRSAGGGRRGGRSKQQSTAEPQLRKDSAKQGVREETRPRRLTTAKEDSGSQAAGARGCAEHVLVQRHARERPALTSLLDRLNKPLIAPK